MSGRVGVQVRGLVISRGHRCLAEVDLQLEPGQVLQVFGPNGSGKTTLLRALGGAVESRFDAATLPDSRWLMGGAQGLRPELTVAQHWRELVGVAVADAPTGRSALQQAGLQRRADQLVGLLSDGQRARLMLAAAHVRRDTLWLVDEPLNTLDADGQRLFGLWLAEHLLRGGLALVATHRDVPTALNEVGLPAALDPLGQAHWAHAFVPALYLGASADGLKPRATESERAPTLEDHDRLQTIEPPIPGPAVGWLAALRRELALMKARPQDLIWPLAFNALLLLCYPLGVHSGRETLPTWGPTLLWTAAQLTVLLSAHRLFELDAHHGVLRLWQVQGHAMVARVGAKLAAHWLALGLPVAFAAVPVSLAYGLSVKAALFGAAGLMAGTLAMSAGALVLAALGLMARQAQVLMGLLLMPLMVPVLILGTALQSGRTHGVALVALWALGLFAALSALPICARLIRWSQA